MSPQEDQNRRLLRARDAMDRDFAKPLDVPGLAAVAFMSAAHFSRSFRAAFGETPHRYLQRRRIERAMALLRETATPVTDVAREVGFESLSTFIRTFGSIVGSSPTEFRAKAAPFSAPICFVKSWTRPSSFGQAESGAGS
ncbi:transcriptional regulator [Acrocarpospora phusangensis]|uniref:Transcriptional regulator n=1 Tax=Acrocarpospora phusangensis TaxID=1070424 RepID=A0A919UK20_9ACTN|nr:helix-turn-helix transcriptional regulator [Acrocarpospora phusangensis]GIH24496.1 transcriptional regulator [Acrocarpospora phusangensis]